MDAIDQIIRGIKRVDELLDEAVMEPDIWREDWAGMRPRIRLLQDAIQSDVLAFLDEALDTAPEPNMRGILKRRVAGLLASTSVLVYAGGDLKGFLHLIGKATELSQGPDQKAELDAAQKETEAYCRLEHARWLQHKNRHPEAAKILKGVARTAASPALQKAAKSASP